MIKTQCNLKTLSSVTPQGFLGNGIFYFLSQLDIPWDKTISMQLDMMYYGNHAGEKWISPLIMQILNTTDTLTDENMQSIAKILYAMYNLTWQKQYATLSLQYNPIDNYAMKEHEEITGKTTDNTTKNVTDDYTRNITNGGTESHDITVKDNGNNKETLGTQRVENSTTQNQNSVYGFNSDTAAPNDSSSGSGNNTINDSGSNNYEIDTTQTTDDVRTVNLTQGIVDKRTYNDNLDGSRETDNTRTLIRSGNIGVTSSQRLLESERNLWMWNFFENIVFPDIDKVMCLSVY